MRLRVCLHAFDRYLDACMCLVCSNDHIGLTQAFVHSNVHTVNVCFSDTFRLRP